MTGSVDLEGLPFVAGGHLLVKRALAALPVGGGLLRVVGRDPALGVHLRAWCRHQGHRWAPEHGAPGGGIERGGAQVGRWRGAERAGRADPQAPGAIAERAKPEWGLAARGATVEAGAPAARFRFCERDEVWSDDAPRLYARAVAAQWDPATAIDWGAALDHPPEVEAAVVQVMTYLVENELAALVVPSGLLARVHPHFREVLQVLAIQAADEARHVEVFSRRISLSSEPALSTAGGQASLATLLEEADFALASFLLSVLGEGSFLSLLWFLAERGPDAITRRICTLGAQDEARHVAFGLSHLERRARLDGTLRARLAAAVERRHAALQHTAGLNEEVYDALVLIAAGSWAPDRLRAGFDAVQQLTQHIHDGRRARLERLGFTPTEAEAISSLHTRNFM